MHPHQEARSAARVERSPPPAESPSSRTRADTVSRPRTDTVSVRDVHVWLLDCTRHRDAGHIFDSALDARERARLRLMRRADARLHFSAGRWVARYVLARRLGCAESEVELTVGAHGRPSPVTGEVDFNLSHAGSFVVLALSETRVGVDVEVTNRATDWRSIAHRFFSAAETAAIEACAKTEQRAAFFRTWVRKEAFAKALGTGVATGFDRFDVSTGAEPALTGARIDGVDASEWSIRDFAPGLGHLGAVAVRATRPRVRFLDVGPSRRSVIARATIARRQA